MTLCISFLLSSSAVAADEARQAEVAKLSAEVMPFSLKATKHVFTKTADGGVQRVVANSTVDAQQVQLVREHLRAMQTRFLAGDFSGPIDIHGAEMPGLAELRAARPGQITIDYQIVEAGAELIFRAPDANLVAALHRWFDAQLSDHGTAAMAEHLHHDQDATMKHPANADVHIP
ncbi:MAG: aspartate carbamoyltransferase [Rhizobacter sp.]